ncbi:hypothetical protein JHK82_055661 [Glycine max]|nr:hypothetical protein JHK82_055661 [Glycine max]
MLCVADLWNQGNWNLHQLYTLLPQCVIDIIQNVLIPRNQTGHDVIAWLGNTQCIYTTSSTYSWYLRNPPSVNLRWKKLWQYAVCLPSCSKCVLHEMLSTRGDNASCPMGLSSLKRGLDLHGCQFQKNSYLQKYSRLTVGCHLAQGRISFHIHNLVPLEVEEYHRHCVFQSVPTTKVWSPPTNQFVKLNLDESWLPRIDGEGAGRSEPPLLLMYTRSAAEPFAKRMKKINKKMKRKVTLPFDLIVEILLRLSVRSLLRFKCVSKSWCALISDPEFAKSHIDMAAAPTHRFLFTSSNASELNAIDVEAEEPLCDDSANVVFKVPPSSTFKYYKHSPMERSCEYLSGFGYDPSTDDYVIVNVILSRRKHPKIECFSLRANSWSCTKSKAPYRENLTFGDGVFLNGALHWLVKPKDKVAVIIAFDVTKRTLLEIPLPHDLAIMLKFNLFRFMVRQGCLVLCSFGWKNTRLMPEIHIHSHLLTQSLTHSFLSKSHLSSFATSTPPSSSPSTLTLKSSTAFNLPLLATSLDAHDDIVYRYNVHANLIEPNLSLGKGCFEDNVADYAFWGNSLVCITKANQLFCIVDFRNPSAMKLLDPKIEEMPHYTTMIKLQYTLQYTTFMLKLQEDEIVAVNSIFEFHKLLPPAWWR